MLYYIILYYIACWILLESSITVSSGSNGLWRIINDGLGTTRTMANAIAYVKNNGFQSKPHGRYN